MRNLFLIISICVVLAILLIFQTTRLSKLRRDIAEMKVENENSESLISNLKTKAEGLKRQLKSSNKEISTLRPFIDALDKRNKELEKQLVQNESIIKDMEDRKADIGDEIIPPEEDVTEGKNESADAMEGMSEYLDEIMKDPDMVELIRQNQKSALNMMYGDMFKNLDLSEEALEKFKDLLVDKQMVSMELGLPLMKGNMEEAEKEEARKNIEEKQARIDEDIELLLGEAAYEEFQDYTENLEDRMLLGQYKRKLESTGIESLEEHQEQELLQAIGEEKEKDKFSSDFANSNDMDLSRFTEDNIRTYLDERTKMYERVFERCETILTADQLAQYKSSIDSQLKMEKMGMEMAMKMFSSKTTTEEKTSEETDSDNPTDNTSHDE